MTLKEFLELCNEYKIEFSIDNFNNMIEVIFKGISDNNIEHHYRRCFSSNKADLDRLIEEVLKDIINLVKEEEEP